MTLVKYIFKRFFPAFIAALLFFAMVLELVDVLMNLWNYISAKVPLSSVFHVMWLYLPKSISYALPISVLFGSAYSLSDLYAKNELVVVFAAGVPLILFTLPVLLFSFLMTFASFFFEDRIVVPTYAKKVELENKLLNVSEPKSQSKVVVRAENSHVIYYADEYDDDRQRLTGLQIVILDDFSRMKTHIYSPSAYWREGQWAMTEFSRKDFDVEDQTKDPVVVRNLADLRFDEPPESFQHIVISVETISVSDARGYIAYLRRAGLPTGESLSFYYKKFSFHAVLLIVVFLSIGLSGKARKNVLLISLALCCLATVLFYVTQMVTMLLAKNGMLSPMMGAWFPTVLFIFISLVLLKFSRT